MSTKIGRTPSYSSAFTDAANVNDGTITSSPRPHPMPRTATCNAAVPELIAIAWGTPT
jgi:hypothetical protein